MDHKEQLGKTDNDSDDHGKTGNEIHLNNNEKRISDIEKQGYVFVKSDFTKGDKYGTEDSHFNVYFKHGITPSTDKTKKEDIKSETTSVKCYIYYRDAQTGELVRDELKKYGIKADVPDITQTLDYIRVPLYDLFNGNFLGFAALYVDPNGFAKDGKPEIKKAANGQPIIATKDNKASWVPTGEYTEYPEQGSPDLTKYGYKKVRVLDSRTEDDNDGGKVVDHKASDPTKDGADVNVYYFHDQEDVTTDKPGKSEETKNPEEHKVPGKQKEEKKPEETKKTPKKKQHKTSKKSDKSETKVASEKSTKKSIKAIKKTVDKSPNSAPHSEDWNKNHAPHSEWNENHAARGEWQSNHGQWQANNMPKSEEMSNSSSVTEDKTNTLPQTGEKDSNNSVMGLIALSFASLLSIFGLNRKKKN